jgi:2',3'-cyclic-nucleotide 2'-phosphodiesterase (5'-nucleotidase family)
MNPSTRRILLCCLALVLLLPLRGAVEVPRSDRLHVVVLHTNDMHGQVVPRLATWLKEVDPVPDSGGLARVAAAVARARREATGSRARRRGASTKDGASSRR